MITFKQPTVKKSVLLTIILDKATELLTSKTLNQFNCDLQSFINSLKLTNYLQPKDIFILQGHPNRIELFKRDGSGNMVFVTSFKETEATPNIEVQGSEFKILRCHICLDEAKISKANPNLYAGFFDADLNVFVCDYTSCNNTHYYRKSKAINGVVDGKVSGEHNFSEVPISIGSEHIFIEKIKNGTTTPKTESKKNSDHTTPEKVITLGEALRPEKYYTLTSEKILNNFFGLSPFIKNGKLNEVVRIMADTIDKCCCTYCNKYIEKGKLFENSERFIKHHNSEIFYIYCQDCVNELGFPLFVFPTEETPNIEVQGSEFKPYTLNDFAAWKVPLHCHMCNEKCTTDTNLVSGFFDADLNVYVHSYKECKNKFYEYKNTTKFKYMISEVPITIVSVHIFLEKIKKANTARPTIEFLNIQLNFEQIEKFYNTHINNKFSKDEPFFKDGIYLDIKSFEFRSSASDGSTLNCKCEECDKPILGNLGGYFQAWLRHDGGHNNNNFGVLCNDCAKSPYYIKFDLNTNNAKTSDTTPIEKTPNIEPTTPILELKQKKQIAIKPSELPPIKAMQKNNSKSINDTYAGGKNASGIYQFLINHVPPVKCIVSGFLGHCGLLKNIKPAKMMVGIDKDVLVTDKWNKENTSVKLITGDFLLNLDWVNPKQFGETLVFLDPPYLDETRASQGKLYNYEFNTAEQHKTLLEKAINFPCYVMITAYENTLYNAYLDGKNGFTKHYFKNQTRAFRKQECMYINYVVPTQLHDYKYYGEDYRERWNNKKLIDRTISQLKDMPPLRRNMVIDAILNQQF